MGKRSRRAGSTPVIDAQSGAQQAADPGEVPVVGSREPCPCGSGKRYKLCHGKERRRREVAVVERPFAGLPGEADWVALREIVPAATATARTLPAYGGVDVVVATVLPLAWPAMRRPDGSVQVALQTTIETADPGRAVAAALLAALEAEPGVPVGPEGQDDDGPRLPDVLDPAVPFTVTVHPGFAFWLEGEEDAAEAPADGGDAAQEELREARRALIQQSMERADDAVVPTARLASVEAAYWCRIGSRRHLRWVLPHPEDALLDGLARLHAAGGSTLLEGARFVGAFRTSGLVVPVWDLPPECEPEELEQPAADFLERLDEAVGEANPLTVDQRRARAGLVSRQVTLR